MKKIDWNREFPEVPDMVHRFVLEALSELDGQEEPNMKKRYPKKRLILLAAACAALIGTTAAAAGIFKWNERAGEVFQADEEAQERLNQEQLSQELSQSVTDQGLTITAVQTIQDKNRFYALFEVTAEDEGTKITAEQNMQYTLDFKDGEDPFCALGWGFVHEEDQEVSNTRYFEIYGTKMENISGDLEMEIHFTALEGEPEEKAGQGAVVLEGNWDFSLDIHETESIRHELQKEYEIAGYPVTVEAVELSPISLTIFYSGDSIRSMEEGEQIRLDQLDDLPALYPTGVRYEDGTGIIEQCYPMKEGYMDESRSIYRITMQFTKVVDADRVCAFLMGDDEISF